jgi:hypothetical protein
MNTTMNINTPYNNTTDTPYDIATKAVGASQPINNKLNNIARLLQFISSAANMHTLVESSNLTVTEIGVNSGVVNSVPLLPHGLLSDSETRELDRQLQTIVQVLMGEKIEDAISQLKDLGVQLDDNLYLDFTVLPEDNL